MHDDDEPLDFTITRDFVTDAEEICDGLFELDDTLCRGAPSQLRESARRIYTVINNPLCVFSGLRRQGLWHESFCYCVPIEEVEGVPRFAGQTGQVMLCFVSRVKYKMTIFDWYPRAEDHDRPGFPFGWQDDFEQLVWERP